MKSSKILTGILAVLGFQSQSCVGTDEYGCPYITYKIKGSVQDANGHKIPDAEISVKVDGIVERRDSLGVAYKDTISDPVQTLFSNKKGDFETTIPYNFESYLFEIITNKDGYEPDTIHRNAEWKDFSTKKVGEWETLATYNIGITLKKK